MWEYQEIFHTHLIAYFKLAPGYLHYPIQYKCQEKTQIVLKFIWHSELCKDTINNVISVSFINIILY